MSPFRVVFLGEPALDSSKVRFLVDLRQLEAVARRWSHMQVPQDHTSRNVFRILLIGCEAIGTQFYRDIWRDFVVGTVCGGASTIGDRPSWR